MDKLRLRILSQLGLVWTFARLGWGLIALTTVLRGWLVEASRSRLFYSVVLVSNRFHQSPRTMCLTSLIRCCCAGGDLYSGRSRTYSVQFAGESLAVIVGKRPEFLNQWIRSTSGRVEWTIGGGQSIGSRFPTIE